MTITLRCECGEVFYADARYVGRMIRCRCGAILEIRRPSSEPEPESLPQTSHFAEHGSMDRTVREERTRITGKTLAAVALVLVLLGGGIWVLVGHPANTQGGSSTPTSAPPATPLAWTHSVEPPAPMAPPEQKPCPDDGQPRPRSGYEIGKRFSGGLGRLRVSNGMGSDAVAVLYDIYGTRPLRAIYIRSGEEGLMMGIPVGGYRLRFQFGDRWLRSREFCRPHGTSEFQEMLEFTETTMSDGIQYSEQSVTLNPVVGGNAQTNSLPDSSLRVPAL